MTSLSDPHLLPTLYSALSTPNHSPPSSLHQFSTPTVPKFFDPLITIPITPFRQQRPFLNDNGINGRVYGYPDSLSRKKAGHAPVLEHILSVGHGRTLSLAADDKFIYAGAQSLDNEITVFSRTSMQIHYRLLGHTGSVLALLVVEERNWLISSSSDGTVRIWSTESLQPLSIIVPYANTSGDVYSLAWDPRGSGVLYMGSQSTDIQWVSFSSSRSPVRGASSGLSLTPGKGRVNGINTKKFFTATPTASGRSTPIQEWEEDGIGGSRVGPWVDAEGKELGGTINVGHECVVSSAHYGYVYSMLMVEDGEKGTCLFSGSGDCDVKAWRCLEGGGLEYLFAFDDLPGAVLSLATRDSLLFAGLQDGPIKIWDLESKACIRSILAQQSDVLCLSFFGKELYSSAGDGQVLRFDEGFDCTATFQAHENAILSSIVVRNDRGGTDFVTAGREIKVWTISDSGIPERSQGDEDALTSTTEGDVMLYALAKLVAVPSISDGAHREQSRQCAHLLKKILQQLGAATTLLAGGKDGNPLVLATFHGGEGGKGEGGMGRKRKRVLFYGHYDIQPAEEKDWINDPFELTGRDGFLIGRGVADNKGPIMAVACAVASLRERRQLDVDVVMLIEGEEEAGSAGFTDAVTAHQEEIGPIDCVFLSNSSWIGETDPCVVYGMRGVIYASLTIVSPNSHDAHSGVDGGTVEEPMAALNELLTEISRKGKCNIPGFYDDVQNQGQEEKKTYEDLARLSGTTVEALTRKWSAPTFSCSNITSSGPSNRTIIPRKVTANVSFRLVPNQKVNVIADALERFCHDTFDRFNSEMRLEVSINHKASWWLASPENCYFKAIEDAISTIWGVSPLRIREGGSIPTIPFLEHLFAAPCIHLPIGQRTSNAHLSNERLRLLNLRNGKKVVEEWLIRVGKMC